VHLRKAMSVGTTGTTILITFIFTLRIRGFRKHDFKLSKHLFDLYKIRVTEVKNSVTES
jgi:hypothetical protein